MESKKPQKVRKISHWVKNITNKVPVVKGLEKRLEIMQNLDPIMDGILEKMEMVTDNSNLRALQHEQKHTEWPYYHTHTVHHHHHHHHHPYAWPTTTHVVHDSPAVVYHTPVAYHAPAVVTSYHAPAVIAPTVVVSHSQTEKQP